MGAFAGMKDAKRGFDKNPLRPGRYVVRIDSCEFFEFVDRKGKDSEAWKNTLTILAVEEGDHRVGEIVHTYFGMAGGKKTFQMNLKSFLAGVLDVPDEAIDEAAATAACSEDSQMKGLVTVVTGRGRRSKSTIDEKTGEPVEYTVYSWSPCMNDDEIIAAIGEEAFNTFFPNG